MLWIKYKFKKNKINYMRQLVFLFIFFFLAISAKAQTYTSGLTSTGSGSGTNVRLGGTNPLLVNTTVDMGTFTFGFKKSSANYFTILNNGNIGIGNASPTSLLHLKAGTAASNTAPLKFTNGVNLSSPEAGAMEFNGSSLFFTPSTSRLEIAFADLSNITGTLLVTKGGTGVSSLASGDILYASAANTFSRLAKGTDGQFLTLSLGVPTWSSPTTGWGLTGNSGTNSATNFIGTTDNTSFAFRTNNTEKLRIDAAGNIGIGNTTPAYKLDVNGKARFTSDMLVNGMSLGLGAGAISSNTMLGYQAGQLNTTGTDNSFIGYQAGINNTTGSYNYFFGNQAGVNNTTGNYNSFIAYHAGYSNIDGNANNFIGYGAGFSNASGSYNNFIGTNAGYSNTSGNGNVFISRYTGLNNTTGNNNSFIGYASGSNNTTGSFNSLLGYHSGYYIAGSVTTATIINNSVLIGSETKPLGDNQTNQVVIGYDATGLGSNTTVLGNSSTTTTAIYGNLLLGTTIDDGFRLKITGNTYTNGKILIGTDGLATSSHMLAVNGSAIFTKAVVKLTGAWPDYVFRPDYNLLSLNELEVFLIKNQHLPDVPCNSEIVKNGIDLGDNQTVLLKKVEELTLYMIALNKKVEALSKENELLKRKINSNN